MHIASIDIESTSDPSVESFLPAIEPHKGRKPGSESYNQWIIDKENERREKMPLTPSQNLIVCIGIVDNSGREKAFSIPKHTDDQAVLLEMEKNALIKFWEYLSEMQYGIFVTCNGLNFDIPTLNLHSVRHNIPVSVRIDTAKYRQGNHLDIYGVLNNHQRLSGGLDYLAQYFGLPGKQGMSGKMVPQMFRDGRIDEIAEYCLSDCKQTLAIGQKIIECNLWGRYYE